MPSASTLAAFAAAAFVLIAVPGPNMIYLVARSLTEGRREGRLVVMGLAIGAFTALAAGTLSERLRRRRAGARPWGRWASGTVYLALGAYAALSPAHRTTD